MFHYKVACGHDGCTYNQVIVVDQEVGEWQPPHDTGLLDSSGNPVIEQWAGQPIEDAYQTHYQASHPGLAPLCCWEKV